MDHSIWLWVGFTLFILLMLALDLGVFHRRAHVVGLREAAVWSAVWITMALLFNAGVYLWIGSEEGLAFLTGYVIEKSLSVDNVFVWLVIFSYFAVPAQYQHRVLFWGILGAMVLRGIFIAAGVTLLNQFEWVIYIFGAFLLYTGFKLAFRKDEQVQPERNPVLRLARRFIPVTSDYHGQRFFIRQHGRWIATPLLMVLVVIEATDVVFAADSIPAILAVTRDPFIVWTSNVFAILGLRALFFLVAGILRYFRYLNVGLALVLCFVGAKMLISDVYHVPTSVSLGTIAGILGTTMLASYLVTRRLVAATAPKVGDAPAEASLHDPVEPS
ncbi:MAG: TerC family protein [Chloroflexi bacterium]|nr:TerC family protein [Chloroflexota bacterium]